MNVLSQGDGQLFSDPSANHARAHFAAKPRALTDKRTTVQEAVARLLQKEHFLHIDEDLEETIKAYDVAESSAQLPEKATNCAKRFPIENIISVFDTP